MSEESKPASKTIGRPFVKGQSGNPKGRRPQSDSLAEAVRAKWPAAKIVEAMGKHASSKDEAIAIRAKEWLADRGFGKAPQTVDLTVIAEETAPVDWGAVPLDRRRELLASMAAIDEIADPDGEGTPEG